MLLIEKAKVFFLLRKKLIILFGFLATKNTKEHEMFLFFLNLN